MCIVRMGHKIRQERMMGAIRVGASSGGHTSLYKSHDRMNISGVRDLVWSFVSF